MDPSPVSATNAFPSVSVLCAKPISGTLYDFNHRLAFYLSLLFVLTGPAQKYLTPAAITFVLLYSACAALHGFAFLFFPGRVGLSIDIYPINQLLDVYIYGFAFLVFVRKNVFSYVSQWGSFLWFNCMVYLGFVAALYVKFWGFELRIKNAGLTQEVQCQAMSARTDMAGMFKADDGIACQNPCSANGGVVPLVWGVLDPQTRQFSRLHTIDEMSVPELVAVCIFGFAVSLTLCINSNTSLRSSRAAVYNFVAGQRASCAMRRIAARIVAASWFVWSCFCLGLPAVGIFVMIFLSENVLAKYPVGRACMMMGWAPWLCAVALGMLLSVPLRNRLATSAGDYAQLEDNAAKEMSLNGPKEKLVNGVNEFGEWLKDPTSEKAQYQHLAADEEQGVEQEMA